jgi:hypothetical protein
MVSEEFKNSTRVYKVQTFGTLHATQRIKNLKLFNIQDTGMNMRERRIFRASDNDAFFLHSGRHRQIKAQNFHRLTENSGCLKDADGAGLNHRMISKNHQDVSNLLNW